MANFQPPPTFADVILFELDGSRPKFNPIWLKWFLDVAELLPGGGTPLGTVTSVAESFTGGLISITGSPVTGAGTLALTVAGTSGGIPYFSSGTTWASSAALAAGALVLGGGAGTTPATLAHTATAGQILRSGATAAPSWSTATYPATATGTGTLLRADGTNWAATTATYPTTTTVSQLLYSSAANVVAGLATANNGVLKTSATGVPSIETASVAWTPADGSGAGLALTVVADGCRQFRLGPLVYGFIDIAYPATADGTTAAVSGLTVTSLASTNAVGGGAVLIQNAVAGALTLVVDPNTTTIRFALGAALRTNAQMSGAIVRAAFVYPAA